MRLGKLLLKDGYIYVHGQKMNMARLDRAWPFHAEILTPTPGMWEESDAIFPGSYIQASNRPYRVKDTPEARKFLRPGVLMRIAFALGGKPE